LPPIIELGHLSDEASAEPFVYEHDRLYVFIGAATCLVQRQEIRGAAGSMLPKVLADAERVLK
jgi:hypothetical protein